MDDLLTIKEAAAQMKVTDRTIRRWIADGRLDASKIARTVRIRRKALEDLTQADPGTAQASSQNEAEAPFQAPEQSAPILALTADATLPKPSPSADKSPPVKHAEQPPTTPQISAKPPPDLQTILTALRRELPFLRSQYNVHLLGVFGSYRRGEQTPDCDLNLLVAFRETPGLLKYIELEYYLSDLVEVRVELVMGDALKAHVEAQDQREVALV